MSAVVSVPSPGLRPMTLRDLSAVMEIEAAAYPYPWSEGIFRDCIRVGYPCMVYEEQGLILAYGVVSIGVGECHILNLCVRPREQGRGLGRQLLGRLLGIARHHDVDTVTLEVRPSNTRAIGLYVSEGFHEAGRRKDYYPAEHGREDALIMAKTLL